MIFADSNIGIDSGKDEFRILFDCFYPSLCLFALKYTRDKEVAEDLCQDAFVELWKNISKFENKSAAKSYLYTVTRNKCLNHIKLCAIRNQRFEELNTVEFFEEVVLEEETYQILQNAISQLPSQTRKIVELSLTGIKNKEIAEHLSISVNTVKTLKRLAYRDLRITLKDCASLLFFLSIVLT